MKQIVRSQGILGLWSGLPASLLYRTNFFWLFGSIEVSSRSGLTSFFPSSSWRYLGPEHIVIDWVTENCR